MGDSFPCSLLSSHTEPDDTIFVENYCLFYEIAHTKWISAQMAGLQFPTPASNAYAYKRPTKLAVTIEAYYNPSRCLHATAPNTKKANNLASLDDKLQYSF